MNKKLGELKINKSADYDDEVVKALEEAGYILVLEWDGMCEKNYIIAKSESEEQT